jgi:hypothetical protein
MFLFSYLIKGCDQEEKSKLIHLADRLRKRVIGQDKVVNLFAQDVLRSRAGLDQSTCGWVVRRAVAPPAHQSSNPRFDTLVSH